MNNQFQQFDQTKQTRYMPVSGNGMSVHTETIDPKKLIYRLEYGNSDVFHNHAIVNGMKRALSAIEHQYFDTKGRIKKTRLIYSDGFESYREFNEFGRLVVDDNTKERVEFEYSGLALKTVRLTRPIFVEFNQENKGNFRSANPDCTTVQLMEIKRVIKTYPWATCFHHFNPFDQSNQAQCDFSRMAGIATDFDEAIIPIEYAIGGH